MNYTQITRLPDDYLKRKIGEFLAEDAPDGDKTTEGIFTGSENTTAIIQAQEDIIFAGEQVIKALFEGKCKVTELCTDGSRIPNGGIIARIEGPASIILTLERTALNIIQRLSGIATYTNKFAEIAKPWNVKILDTRKTTPGLRMFEKFAVVAGGGTNHRFDLSSGILIKDNHIKAAGSIKSAVEKVREAGHGLPIEVETENFDEIRQALEAGADIIMLDNMPPPVAAEAVKMIRAYPGGDKVFIEASGGINLNTIAEYVKTGIDAASVGSLTHSVKSAEIHMEFED